VDLDGERGTVRLKESNLANEIADSQRAFLDADIAFQNGGGVRASIQSGTITVGDIIAMLPFDNKLMKVEVDGKTVWEALENGVKPYPSAAGQFLQVSGLRYAFDPSKPAGSRIVDVTMDDGSKLDFGKKYTVVINDFMAGGGDGYSMLKCTGVGANDPDVALLLSTNYYLRDVFREYVAAKGAIAPKTTGRITIVDK
jgi:2',3'-cyclic-nucleotide 2'-phosphodiesterase (5'-nucleotidase family)